MRQGGRINKAELVPTNSIPPINCWPALNMANIHLFEITCYLYTLEITHADRTVLYLRAFIWQHGHRKILLEKNNVYQLSVLTNQLIIWQIPLEVSCPNAAARQNSSIKPKAQITVVGHVKRWQLSFKKQRVLFPFIFLHKLQFLYPPTTPATPLSYPVWVLEISSRKPSSPPQGFGMDPRRRQESTHFTCQVQRKAMLSMTYMRPL